MQDFETPDISEFIEACAKRFCPECGNPIIRNQTGRPKSFCSDRCRWAFDKRAKRRKVKENENSSTEGNPGEGPEACGVQSAEEAEARG